MDSTDRWLLNNLSTVELALLVVGGGVMLSVLGFLVVRRLYPAELRIENNDVAGVLLGLLGAFYGIVLGFAIVVLFEDFRAADQSVKAETTALAQVYRTTDLFPSAERIAVGKAIAQYALAVRTLEWPLMRDGHESQRAHDLFGAIYTSVEQGRPKTDVQKAFFQEAVARLDDLLAARRARLNASVETLPPVFQVLLLGGALVLIVFLFFFGTRNFRAHLVMLAGVTSVLTFSLLLTLMLAFPFSGQIAVSSSPFKLGIVGRLDPATGVPRSGLCDNCFGPP